jgi:transposase
VEIYFVGLFWVPSGSTLLLEAEKYFFPLGGCGRWGACRGVLGRTDTLIFHNTELGPDNIVRKYFEKDVVERSFRTMKGDTQLHPIRLWLPTRINAHIKLCYLSLCLLSLIQFKCKGLKISIAEIINQLQSIYQIKLKHTETNKSFTKIVTQTNQQKRILEALGCSV